MKSNGRSSGMRVVIVGGGCAGITTAAMLLRRAGDADVAIIEPSEDLFYQPAWTLVGGGCYDIKATRRKTAAYIPPGAKWIKKRVVGFEPEASQVSLEDGSKESYDFLVVAAGIQLNWDKVQGRPETLGKNGVSSNYRFDLAPYTWQCIERFAGGTALFTQPAMPIKCAGAPQKIMYLAADRFQRRGIKAEISFLNVGPVMFGVPFFSQALDKVAEGYGIRRDFGHTLVEIDGARKEATFEVAQKDGAKTRTTRRFDFIHVTPPQSAPDFIRNSPLSDQAGWVAVDKNTLQHTRFVNVFALGDCSSTPNAKTAAAVRKQAPILVENLLRVAAAGGPERKYDGYGSCPLTTSVGKIMLAEFCYDGKVTPTFPGDPREPRASMWQLKRHFLPYLYWNVMLRGKDWSWPGHKERSVF